MEGIETRLDLIAEQMEPSCCRLHCIQGKKMVKIEGQMRNIASLNV
jgi:hypothetical protein